MPRIRPRVVFAMGFLAALTAGLVTMAAAQKPTRPVVTTGGLVSGNRLGHGMRFFAGIPFARPPVGKLRWRPPQPARPWKGVLAARKFGAPCYQAMPPRRMGPWTRAFNSQLPSSENCLYLNLWTPARAGERLPVMVFIYGGGYTSGAGSVAIYKGVHLAQHGVVVVNFNYRVGPFGFLAYPGLVKESRHHSAGNYGLLDQIAALRWVRQNIANFGGDSGNITIFGQSAGASSVWLLMQSPLARGLFRRAIIMSGPGTLPFPAMMTAQENLAAAGAAGKKFAASLGAKSLRALRALPAAKILQGHSPIGFAPITDGWVLPAGAAPYPQARVINGMVADDIGIGYYGTAPPPPFTMGQYRRGMRRLCGAQAGTCRRLYPARNARQAERALRQARRDRAKMSLALWARRQLRYSPAVYTYDFDHRLPWPQHPEYGVFHSSELPYVFDNLQILHRPWQPRDRRIAREMPAYWTNFAKNGNPNQGRLPHWPRFRARPLRTMELGVRMGPMRLMPAARERFWEKQLHTLLGF